MNSILAEELEVEQLKIEPAVFTGLCQSCKHTEGCTFLRTSAVPVIQCEEYQPGFPMMGLPPVVERELKAQPRAVQGMCGSCELRETCTYSRPAGGVWHCQEYL